MSSQLPQNIVQFSTDVFSQVPTPCERSSCNTIIQLGERRLYVANSNRDKQGKFVCEACYKHYMSNPDTLRRTTMSNPLTSGGVNMRAELASIQRLVNESQRQGSHTPAGRVTPLLSVPFGSAQSAHIPNSPVVANPIALYNYELARQQLPVPVMRPPMPAHVSGYSQAHNYYALHRNMRASQAYPLIPVLGAPRASGGSGQVTPGLQCLAQMVHIIVEVSYIGDTTKSKMTFAGIKEGGSVDYNILPPALFEYAKNLVSKSLAELRSGFSWDFSSMILREAVVWQDVLKKDHGTPYFSGQFLKKPAGRKSDGTLIFAPPARPVEFQLVIDNEQWMQAGDYMDELYEVQICQNDKRKAPPSPEKNTILSYASHRPPAKKAHTRADTELMNQPSNIKLYPTHYQSPPATVSLHRQASNKIVLESENENSEIYEQLGPECIRQCIVNIGAQSRISMEQRERDRMVTEHVACCGIHVIPFPTLCKTIEKAADIIISKEYFGAFLYYDPLAPLLGKGAFKTATPASLQWITQPNTGLGSSLPPNSHISVALKRPYQPKDTGHIKRLNPVDESELLHIEGTSLGMAQSLLNYSYSFIDAFIRAHPALPVPFKIPRVRFVQALIAYAQKNLPDNMQKAPRSYRAVYFLEELLDSSQEFVKYVHNGSATPFPMPSDEGYALAEFFCFLQHVQFTQTHALAFISDFQGEATLDDGILPLSNPLGAGDLLTDPQVITKPGIGKSDMTSEDVALFGDGNVDSAYEEFPAQHKCNKFCHWFELDELTSA